MYTLHHSIRSSSSTTTTLHQTLDALHTLLFRRTTTGTSDPPSTSPSTPSSSLSYLSGAGPIIGITIAIVFVLILILVTAWALHRRSRRRAKARTSNMVVDEYKLNSTNTSDSSVRVQRVWEQHQREQGGNKMGGGGGVVGSMPVGRPAAAYGVKGASGSFGSSFGTSGSFGSSFASRDLGHIELPGVVPPVGGADLPMGMGMGMGSMGSMSGSNLTLSRNPHNLSDRPSPGLPHHHSSNSSNSNDNPLGVYVGSAGSSPDLGPPGVLPDFVSGWPIEEPVEGKEGEAYDPTFPAMTHQPGNGTSGRL